MTSVERTKKIGSGAFGSTVYKAVVNGWLCCLKEFPLDNANAIDTDSFKKEIQTYTSVPCDNEHLCRFLGWRETSTHIQIFLRLYDTSLDKVLQEMRQRNDYFSEAQLTLLAVQLLGALQVLHNRRIMHRDLKGGNVLVNYGDESHLCLVLSDFGESELGHKSRECVGTTRWMAPEVLSATKTVGYSEKVDIWSFGMLLYEMMTLTVPYADEPNHLHIPDLILTGKIPTINDAVRKRYPRVLLLWEELVCFDPGQRLSAADALILFGRLGDLLMTGK